jgi:hypothetical protein
VIDEFPFFRFSISVRGRFATAGDHRIIKKDVIRPDAEIRGIWHAGRYPNSIFCRRKRSCFWEFGQLSFLLREDLLQGDDQTVGGGLPPFSQLLSLEGAILSDKADTHPDQRGDRDGSDAQEEDRCSPRRMPPGPE